MARARKRHEQVEMRLPKLDKNGQLRGGKRDGAGRKGSGRHTHRRRPEISAREPQHVTVRVVKEVGWLRTDKAYRAIRRALAHVLRMKAAFRIVHFSLQGDHLHLLCEAKHREWLASGMRAFLISAAKHLNRELTKRGQRRRRGQVFADRYFVESIDSVAQTCRALSYVLNNWRKHGQDRRIDGLFDGRIDPYSSGVCFGGWKERTRVPAVSSGSEAPAVAQPQTWLLKTGYARGRPISVYDVPGPRLRARI